LAAATRSFEWYPKHGARLIGSVAQWLREEKEELGTYDYLSGTADRVEDGSVDLMTMDYLTSSQACVVGDPEDAIETFKAYEATGCDLVFCLLNPYDIGHEAVMTTIELMGEHVIPAFS
jgi:alkanesulfonate monooxygenase SsuD/methylene tetrahydromethanopterin reductase-like flavin-dependent oxidoreductase (luciferase family)